MDHKVILQDALKKYTHDQDKVLTPEETVKRFKKRLKEIDLDILDRTARMDNGRLDIPVFFSICGKDAEDIIGTKKQMGKGGTPQQAEASAVMELAERFSFFSFWKNRSHFFMDTYQNVKDRAIPFEFIARSVHDDSPDLERAKEIFSNLPLQWTWAYNMTRREEMLIPFDWFYTINEFNGPSAGNCVEEAILQGICEITERHVSSIISRERLSTNAINLNSVTDPLVMEMLGKYQRAGIRLFATDFSLDTGIPSIGVLAYDPTTFPQKSEIVWTAGTTPDPQKALSRALTETAQLAGDFNSNSNYMASGLPKLKTLVEARYVMKSPETIDIGQLPNLADENIKTEIENCIAALNRKGMEVIVVNTTHPRLGIPAFYTMIPGAHFRERSAGTSVGMFSAKIMAEQRDPRWAVTQLKKMNILMPGKYYIQFFLGKCFLLLDDPEAALEYLERALTLNPKEEDIPAVYSYMAQCLKDLERYGDAVSVLKKAEKYDPERTDIFNLMGFCHFKLKEYEKAIQSFQKVLKLNPASAIDYANIGSNYRDMGDTEQAIRYYRIALELDPTIEFAIENLKRLEDQK
ncbi:MAG: YcaO-like family protein [Deltaproteobacteria bacterium]|nr:YcaO-like family protein [Deltaproteobacteria bacterium]